MAPKCKGEVYVGSPFQSGSAVPNQGQSDRSMAVEKVLNPGQPVSKERREETGREIRIPPRSRPSDPPLTRLSVMACVAMSSSTDESTETCSTL